MPNKQLEYAQQRTEAKLRYARIHLQELLCYPAKGSSDAFECSHIESVLFHLFGARDAFLQELNLYYGCSLPFYNVRVHKIRSALQEKGIACPELDELDALERVQDSWLRCLKEMRDYSAHIEAVPKHFFLGGPRHGQLPLKNPKTGKLLEEDYAVTLSSWCTEMEKLLSTLRASAVSTLLKVGEAP